MCAVKCVGNTPSFSTVAAVPKMSPFGLCTTTLTPPGPGTVEHENPKLASSGAVNWNDGSAEQVMVAAQLDAAVGVAADNVPLTENKFVGPRGVYSTAYPPEAVGLQRKQLISRSKTEPKLKSWAAASWPVMFSEEVSDEKTGWMTLFALSGETDTTTAEPAPEVVIPL